MTGEFPASGDSQTDFQQLSASLEAQTPVYFAYRMDMAADKWILIAFVPETCGVPKLFVVFGAIAISLQIFRFARECCMLLAGLMLRQLWGKLISKENFMPIVWYGSFQSMFFLA